MPLKLVPPRAGRSPNYTVRGSHLGVDVNRSTKTPEKGTAQALLRRWQADIERGAIARPGERTFLDAIVSYMKHGGDSRFLGSYDDDTGTWSGIAGRLGALPLSAVDQDTMNETAIALLPEATPATRNRQVYTPIVAVLHHAGVDRRFARPKGWRGEQRVDWMQPEQAFRLIGAAREQNVEFAVFLTLLLYTGMRLGEALGLTCNRVSLAEAWASVPTTKNGDPRMVYLPPAAIAALANHPRGIERGGARLFRFRKCGRLYTWLGNARDAAEAYDDELAFVSFHTFRHTWATWMRRYGKLDTTGLVATRAWRDRQSAARYEHVVVSEEARKADLLPVGNPWNQSGKRRKRG